MKFLVYGHKGWIGQYLTEILKLIDEEVVLGNARIDDEENLSEEIARHKPDRIITTTGRTSGAGFTTIDYLEQKGKLKENLQDNLYGPLTLAIVAKKFNTHVTYLGTGCIFNGYPEKGYTENDKPDFFGSAYSCMKGTTDKLMKNFDNVLNVRIRMPITRDCNPKNFIVKILTYEKICSMNNSMTVLPELLPVMIDMSMKKETGTINLTNPGMISHNEILEMVKEIVDPEFTWKNFSIEEQSKILLSERSNNMLCTDKLEKMYPQVLSIKDSVRNLITAMKHDNLLVKKVNFKNPQYKELLNFLKNDYESSAWKGHLELAMWLVNRFKPKVTVELGVDYGHSTFALASENTGKVYGVDCFEGDEHTNYRNTFDIVTRTYNKLTENKMLNKNIIFIKGSFDDIADVFEKKIDLLHIDGFHEYASVKNDFEKWSEKMSDDGIIIMHDVVSFLADVGKLYGEINMPKTMMPNSAGLGIFCKNQKIIDDINNNWVNKVTQHDDYYLHTEYEFLINK